MLIFTSWLYALRWMKQKVYSKLLCMFALNYQILDTSRTNPLLLQKRGRKREKIKPNSMRSCFNFQNAFYVLFYAKSYQETKVQRWTLFANGCWSDVIWMKLVWMCLRSCPHCPWYSVNLKPRVFIFFWEHNFFFADSETSVPWELLTGLTFYMSSVNFSGICNM